MPIRKFAPLCPSPGEGNLHQRTLSCYKNLGLEFDGQLDAVEDDVECLT